MSIWNSTITQKPLVINIYLETTEPKLFYECHKIDSNRILIESWTLTLRWVIVWLVIRYWTHVCVCASHPLAHIPVDLPDLYKKFIGFFRSLHSLVRLLPSYSLYKRLKRYEKGIFMNYKLSTNQMASKDEVSLGKYAFIHTCMHYKRIYL